MANFTIKISKNRKNDLNQTYVDLNITDLYGKNNVDKNAIKGSIHNLLTFKRGDRVLNPDFGNPLYDVLFETINSNTISSIKDMVKNMFIHEPRVTPTNIDVKVSERDNVIIVYTEYVINSTQETDSVSVSINY